MSSDYYPFNSLEKYETLYKSRKKSVYLLPNNRTLKICKNYKECRREYLILRYGYRYNVFPKIYEYRLGYLIREYVDGECIIDYLKHNTMDKELALNILEMYSTFQKLKFTRLDTGVSHIYVQKNKKIKVLGLKSNCWHVEAYPKHMMSGFRKIKCSKKFMKIVKQERPDIYNEWIKNI